MGGLEDVAEEGGEGGEEDEDAGEEAGVAGHGMVVRGLVVWLCGIREWMQASWILGL